MSNEQNRLSSIRSIAGGLAVIMRAIRSIQSLASLTSDHLKFNTSAPLALLMVVAHLIPPVNPSAFAQTLNASKGKWQVSRSTDAMNDSSSVSVALVAEGYTWSDPRSVIFMVTCDRSGGLVLIGWNRFLGGTKSGEYVLKSITVRAGNEKPVEEDWLVGPNGTTTIRPSPSHDFIMGMRATDKLAVRVQPYQESPLTVTFDTRGMTEALKQARPECEWYLRDVILDEVRAEKAARGEPASEAIRSWHTPK